MSTEEIESYKFQLEQVELALQSDPSNEELLKLKTDLEELISMFKAALTTEKSKKPRETKEVSESQPKTTALKNHEFSVDQEVMARWSGDGQFYKATITAIGGADQVFSVKFKGYDVEFVKAEDIKAIQNNKRTGIFETVGNNNNKKKKTLTTPNNQNNESIVNQNTNSPKKKTKTVEFENKKNAWLNFATGSSKKKKVATVINKNSIFKTPDNPEGKVGVIGSGKGMTTFQQRGKHIYSANEKEE